MPYFYAEFHSSAKNSHKFYELAYDPVANPLQVIAEYGRIAGFGNKGTRQRHIYRCYSAQSAQSKFQTIRDEKYRKGYTTTSQTQEIVPVVKSTIISVDDSLFEQKLNQTIDKLTLNGVNSTMARFRNLELPTNKEINEGIKVVLTKTDKISKRIRKLDLD